MTRDLQRDVSLMLKPNDNLESTSWKALHEFANRLHPDTVTELDQSKWGKKTKNYLLVLICL
jgi:hypothetical protein